jgi:hypothetical protein
MTQIDKTRIYSLIETITSPVGVREISLEARAKEDLFTRKELDAHSYEGKCVEGINRLENDFLELIKNRSSVHADLNEEEYVKHVEWARKTTRLMYAEAFMKDKERVLVCTGHYAPNLNNPRVHNGSAIKSLEEGLEIIKAIGNDKKVDLIILVNDLRFGIDSGNIRKRFYDEFALPNAFLEMIQQYHEEGIEFRTYVVGERKLLNRLTGELKREKVSNEGGKQGYHAQCIDAVTRFFAMCINEMKYDGVFVLVPTCSRHRIKVGKTNAEALYKVDQAKIEDHYCEANCYQPNVTN